MESNETVRPCVGDKILIIEMDNFNGTDKAVTNYNGRFGVVEDIDSIGQLHGTWGGLAIIPGLDKFEIINTESK